MSIKEQLNQDLKKAMLAGDKELVTVLRGLKSTILYAEVESGNREKGLDDQTVIALLQKESKKRQESAALYRQGDDETRAAKEEAEQKIIAAYLPEQLSESEIRQQVRGVIDTLDQPNLQQMGQVIAAVKQQTAGRADGAVIARITKELLGQ